MSRFLKATQGYKPYETDVMDASIKDFGGIIQGPSEENASLYQLDGDTWADQDGNKYRLAGGHAPETTKAFVGGRGELEIKQGEVGGEARAQAVHQIMKQGGFNKIIKTGEVDDYGREKIRVTNDKGEDFAQTLYRTGALKPGMYATEEQVRESELGLLAKELGKTHGYEDTIDQLETTLNEGVLGNELLGIPAFSTTALDESQLAMAKEQSGWHNLASGVEFDDPNRDENNMANNSMGASFNMGWQSLKEGVYGAMEIFGASEMGAEGLSRQQYIKEQMPGIENLDFDEVDGIGDFFQFLGNNAAMSAPYMGLIAGGALLAPAGIAGAAVGAVPTAAVYAGQIWNEMEGEKGSTQRAAALSAGFAAAVVDRLGLAGIVRPTAVLTKEGKDAVLNAMVSKGLAGTREAAEAAYKQNAKAVAVDTLKHMGDVANQQLAAYVARGNLAQNLVKGAVTGGISEGATEAIQETLQYVTATQFSEREFDMYELQDRMRDAALAGGSLGAAISTSSEGWQYGGRYALAKDLESGEFHRLNEIDQERERRRLAGQTINSVEENLAQIREESKGWVEQQQKQKDAEKAARAEGKKVKTKTGLGNMGRAARKHERENRGIVNQLRQIRSAPEALSKTIGGVRALVARASDLAYPIEALRNSEYGHIVSDIASRVGQGRGIIHAGMNREEFRDAFSGTLKRMVYEPQVLARFGLRNQLVANTHARKVSNEVRAFGAEGWHGKLLRGEITKDQLPERFRANADALLQTANEFQNQADALLALQNKERAAQGLEPVPRLEGWWYKHRSFDPDKVKKNRKEWEQHMIEAGMTPEQVADMYSRIEGGQVTNADDYFSHVDGITYTPGEHKARTLNLSEQEWFDKFAQENLFTEMSTAIDSAARNTANTKYFGEGGSQLDYLFDQLREKGMPENQLNEMAWRTKAIIDAADGNYNRIDDPRWAAVQRFMSTWSIVAGLPLAVLSSLPEFAMVAMSMDMKEVSKAVAAAWADHNTQVSDAVMKSLQDGVDAGMQIPVDADGNPTKKTKAHERLDQAGLYFTNSSAANRMGVGEVNITSAWVTDTFFKIIGLSQLTQLQRGIAAAAVGDFVGNRLAELSNVDLNDMNNRQMHVFNELSQLGMDVPTMIDIWNNYGNDAAVLDYVGEKRNIPPEIMQTIDDNMRLATQRFVNQRIQNPGAANRPLFFQDPHWQLLTQFNGFLSTFTANVVPKLWNDYLKNGSPAVKYQTFAMMMAMVALGGAGQWMKDWIKYGRNSPYLSNEQFLQRAIYSSGVLGQAERVIDLAVPIYGNKPRSSFDFVVDTLVGEAGPTVRNVGAVGDVLGSIGDGDLPKASQGAIKLTPFGTFGRFGKAIAGTPFGDFREGLEYYDDL